MTICVLFVLSHTQGAGKDIDDPESILNECNNLFKDGYREVTLLGQNVDSYKWSGGGPKRSFKKATIEQKENAINFAQLLEKVAQINPKLRIRFSTSNPQDMTYSVIENMAEFKNICNYIHLPVQSEVMMF